MHFSMPSAPLRWILAIFNECLTFLKKGKTQEHEEMPSGNGSLKALNAINWCRQSTDFHEKIQR